MLRFTIRDVIWLTVVVGVGVAVWFERSGRDHLHRRAIIHRASDQELAAIRARYKAAKAEFEFHVTRWHSPPPPQRGFGFHWPVDDTCGTIERLAYATEASNDLETQVKDLKSALGLAEYVLATMREQYADDVLAVHRAEYTQASLEAQLRRAVQDLAAARATR